MWYQLGVSLLVSMRLLTSLVSRVSFLVHGAELQLEPSSVQGSVMAKAPAVFQGPQNSLACRLGQLYGCAPSELTTPWTFAWGHGTKGHRSAV